MNDRIVLHFSGRREKFRSGLLKASPADRIRIGAESCTAPKARAESDASEPVQLEFSFVLPTVRDHHKDRNKQSHSCNY